MKRFIVVTVCLCLTGCGVAHPCVENRGAEPKTTINSDGCVALKDVDPPVWNSVFASVSVNGQCHSIDWGTGDDWIMTGNSGYPGFNHPMLVVTNGEQVANCVELVTNYGRYVYECGRKCVGAVLSDNGKNLIKKDTGQDLVNFSASGETLWFYNPKRKEAVSAEFKHGTSVIVN